MLRRPLVPIAIAFAVGVLLAAVSGVSIWVLLVVLVLGFLAAIFWRAQILAVMIAATFIGAVRYQSYSMLPADDVSRFIYMRPAAVIGRVANDADIRSDRATLVLDVMALRVDGQIKPADGLILISCEMPSDDPDWRPPDYGSIIEVRARVREPGGGANPGTFSYRDYLARQRIYATARVYKPKQQILIFSGRRANPIIELAISARHLFEKSIAIHMPSEESAVVTSMVLGSYVKLPDKLMSNFQRTGTLHLLAASGFNCAVLVAVFGFILMKVFKLPRKFAALVLMALVVFYMLIVGAKPSIVRATVMAGLVLLAWILEKPADPLNLLFAAAIAILIFKPTDLFDVGFQLSFSATLALIVILPLIVEFVRRLRKNAGSGKSFTERAAGKVILGICDAAAVTTAAAIATVPISAQYFNYISLVSIPANAVVAAAVLPLFCAGLFMPILSPIPIVGDLTVFVGSISAKVVVSTINWFGGMRYSSVNVPSPGTLVLVGYYILLAVLVKYGYERIFQKQ